MCRFGVAWSGGEVSLRCGDVHRHKAGRFGEEPGVALRRVLHLALLHSHSRIRRISRIRLYTGKEPDARPSFNFTNPCAPSLVPRIHQQSQVMIIPVVKGLFAARCHSRRSLPQSDQPPLVRRWDWDGGQATHQRGC